MKAYKAVIFDLYGTLIDELMHPESNRMVYERTRDEMADMMGVDRAGFAKGLDDCLLQLMVGSIPSTHAAISDICEKLGSKPGDKLIEACVKHRLEYVRNSLSPRPGTVETISALREKGYRVGLISNTLEEVPLLWDETPFAPLFEVVVLSSEVGMAKPDPRIYALAAERLGVESQDCLYIGDGSDRELSGAERAGMTAVLMRAAYDQEDGDRENWEGKRISRIEEVLGLV